MLIVDTFRSKNGNTVDIMQDNFPSSPRDNDNLGTILYCSSRYVLGDKCVSQEELIETLIRKDIISLPVYSYIHGGITINTTGFSCSWDSGQCGIIYIEKSKVRHEFGKKLISKQLAEKVK